MRKTQAGRHKIDKAVKDEFASFGGDPALLDRLINHPGLQVIEELHQQEVERSRAMENIEEYYHRLNESRIKAFQLTKTSEFGEKANNWLKRLNKITMETLLAKSRNGISKRKGIFVTFPEKYFYAAFLVPYTALLSSNNGKKGSPKWKWIERWLADVVKIEANDLRQWWTKEVPKRKTWPTRSTLYALASGSAIFLEKSFGKKAIWTIKRHRYRPDMSMETYLHQRLLKRSIDNRDLSYLKYVFQHVPMVTRDFIKIYPHCASLPTMTPDPLEDLMKKEMQKYERSLPRKARKNLKRLRMAIKVRQSPKISSISHQKRK